MEQEPFTAPVIAAIAKHMNDDHAEDSVLIVRALGGRPSATAAVMTGMDADAIEFDVTEDDRTMPDRTTPDRTMPVRIPWSRPLTERAQVRAEVVRMYRDACDALGLPVRPH